MKYIALLAIFATAFAAPAPENQVIIDTSAVSDEHDGNSPHVEINVYLNGEAPVSDTSSAFRCYYCGNQATNDLRTTAVCKTAGGKIKPCGSKGDGVGCTDSKFTKTEFARQCGIVGCISQVETCSTSSQPHDQEEKVVSNTNSQNVRRYCFDCGNQATNDQRTTVICYQSGGLVQPCGSNSGVSCMNSRLTNAEFGRECGRIGCTSDYKNCTNPKLNDQDGLNLNEL